MAVLGMANEVRSSTGQEYELNHLSTITTTTIRPVSPAMSQADTLRPPSYVQPPSYAHLPPQTPTQPQPQTPTPQPFQTLDIEHAAPTPAVVHRSCSNFYFLLLLFFVVLKLLLNINIAFTTLLCTSRDFRMFDSMLVVWASVAACQMLQAQLLQGRTEGMRRWRYELSTWVLTFWFGVGMLFLERKRDCK